MKTIIAGSRKIVHMCFLESAIELCPWKITRVLCGKAAGVDTLGEEWAKRNGITVDPYPAIWRDKDGVFDRSAGFARNGLMAENADALLAVWDRFSGGTLDMITKARKKKLAVFVHEVYW